jgi:hypothetical protein
MLNPYKIKRNPMEIKSKIDQQKQVFEGIDRNIVIATDLRKKVRPELDGKTLEHAYIENERFSHSYNSPKQNKDEIRAVTGVAEKKTDVLYSEVLSSNFQPTIITYDKYNQEIRGLGNDLTAIVTMSNYIEEDEDFYTLYAKELLTQPAVFFEEQDIFEELNQTKKLKLNVKGGNILQLKDGKKVVHYCKKRVLTCLQVYLGDTSIPYLYFQDQPFIFTYFLFSFGEFKRKFGQYPNADYVSPAGYSSELYPDNYKIHEEVNNMVEVAFYYNPDDNHYAVRANGFYLQDDIKPLPYTVIPQRRYIQDMNANKLISANYAYGRAPISSAKTLQAVNTEMLRLMIRKFRRSVEEPLLNYSNQIYGSDVWLPGSITNVGSDGDLKPLNVNQQQGITSGEFGFYNLVEQKIQEYVGAGDVQQGMAGDKGETATKTLTQQKNFLRNMALTFNAIARTKKQATKQRILNILENHTDPIDKKVITTSEGQQMRNIYERFSASGMQLPDNRKGNIVSIFTDRDLGKDELDEIEKEEDRMEDQGTLTRYRFINKNKIFEFMTRFHVAAENKPLEGSEMAKVLFGEKLNQVAVMQKIVGSQPSKSELEEECEDVWNSKNLFQKTPEGQGEEMLPGEEERTQIGDQTLEGAETGIPSKPSINELNK